MLNILMRLTSVLSLKEYENRPLGLAGWYFQVNVLISHPKHLIRLTDKKKSKFYAQNIPLSVSTRALTPLFGNGAGAHGIGKISGVLTKIGKFDIAHMYDVSIARLIPIIKLALVYYEKRERKKQVWLYSIILWNCKYVTICSVFVL